MFNLRVQIIKILEVRNVQIGLSSVVFSSHLFIELCAIEQETGRIT